MCSVTGLRIGHVCITPWPGLTGPGRSPDPGCANQLPFQVRNVSRSVVSNSLQPNGLGLTRLFCPWDSPGKNSGVDCISFSRVSFWPRVRTWVSCIAGRLFTFWATRKFPSCGYVELGVRDCHLFSTQGYNRPSKVGSHEERKAVSTFHPVSQRDRNQVVERMRMKKNHRENQRQGSVPAALRFLTLVLRDLLVFLPLISEICHCIVSIPPFWLKLATIGSIATKES